jgi:hypothetical protein
MGWTSFDIPFFETLGDPASRIASSTDDLTETVGNAIDVAGREAGTSRLSNSLLAAQE